MRDYVLFQMWGPFRHYLIRSHQFYVEQAEKRLLSQFSNIEDEADKAADEWLELRSQYFNPDLHDLSDFYESAVEAGIEFYELLTDMRDQTRLSVVAGMYHEWDKQLRQWLTRELRRLHNSEAAVAALWRADFNDIFNLFEGFSWGARKERFYERLNACRLVVNVYKHGAGPALNSLKAKHPEYVPSPLLPASEPFREPNYTDHTHLKVTEQQTQEFSEAIVQFWEAVPDNIFISQATDVPPWFTKHLIA